MYTAHAMDYNREGTLFTRFDRRMKTTGLFFNIRWGFIWSWSIWLKVNFGRFLFSFGNDKKNRTGIAWNKHFYFSLNALDMVTAIVNLKNKELQC